MQSKYEGKEDNKGKVVVVEEDQGGRRLAGEVSKVLQLKLKTKKIGSGNYNPNIQKIDETSESFRNFIRRYRNSPATEKAYTGWFRRYVAYSNIPQVKAKIGIDVGDNTDLLLFDDTRKIERHVKNFLDYHYEVSHLSPKTLISYFDAVKRFYKSNRITLEGDIKDYIGTSNVPANFDIPYTYEEIHKMLDKAGERERCIILLHCSSGLRRGAVSELKYGDLRWIEEYGIYEITVYKGFKEEYKTYCSLECASAINSYLDYRKRFGEVITKDSYIIRKQFDTRLHSGKIKISDATDLPKEHKISTLEVQTIIYKLLYAAGIRNHKDKKTRLGDRHRNMATHSFRKFFENKCLESGVDPFYVSVLMGHKAGIGVEKHYYRPASINGQYSLLELYVNKAMPYLTISNESRLRLKNRELEMRMQEDERRFKQAIEQERSKYDGVLDEILRMKKQLGIL